MVYYISMCSSRDFEGWMSEKEAKNADSALFSDIQTSKSRELHIEI